jgi:uncharacterized protein (TIGR00255 family)
MIHSMTAFARVDLPTEWGALQWEIRSVNHRYLETSFRLPEQLRDLEFPLREVLRKNLKRGKVDCRLAISSAEAAHAEINRPALLQLLATVEQLRRDAPETHNPNALDLLRWPGVLTEDRPDPDALKAFATQAFADALDQLIAHRSREGENLATVIRERLREVDRIVAELSVITRRASDELRQRLAARLAELTTSVDPDRLEQEVALLAQRADVGEELDRLAIHVKEAHGNLAEPGPHGRRLDFLMQEFNREANTLASKAVQIDASQHAIDLKVLIEQIREQVQNVE